MGRAWKQLRCRSTSFSTLSQLSIRHDHGDDDDDSYDDDDDDDDGDDDNDDGDDDDGDDYDIRDYFRPQQLFSAFSESHLFMI